MKQLAVVVSTDIQYNHIITTVENSNMLQIVEMHKAKIE